MAESRSIIVLGSRGNTELAKALSECGYAPVFRETMPQVIQALHRGQFAAAALDLTGSDVDSLEFILNIRDVNTEIPILLIGESAEGGYEVFLPDQTEPSQKKEPS